MAMTIGTSLVGTTARFHTIHVAKTVGEPSITIEGMPHVAAREAIVRIRSSEPILERVTVIIQPPVHGDTTGLDLPILMAIRGMDGAYIGELSMTGEVRPVRGALVRTEALAAAGITSVDVPRENAALAALVPGIGVWAMSKIDRQISAEAIKTADLTRPCPVYPDMQDVVGKTDTVLELVRLARTRTPVCLVGPLASGKAMLARRLAGILPDMTDGEALEVTRIHDCAGLLIGGTIIATRPFRAPHHSTTTPGLVGGGTVKRPGEVSLAHHGVLFLDELTEFHRVVLEQLAQVQRDNEVRLVTAGEPIRIPAAPWLIASAMPCACGHLSREPNHCRCSKDTIKYIHERLKLRTDMLGMTIVNVPETDLGDLDRPELRSPSTMALRKMLGGATDG